MLMKSKTFKNEKGEKISIQYREDDKDNSPVIDSIPWVTVEQYKDGIENRKQVIIVAHTTIPTGLSTWEYDLVFDDIWFTPRYVNIKGHLWSTDRSWCDILIDWINNTWLYTVQTSPRFTSTRAINLYDTASDRLQANFVRFINWGLRIDITNASNSVAVDIAIVAYA